jgi:xanthine dehydrogenase large subunit
MSDLKHESARAHVTGRAAYADELPMPQGTLSLYPVQSPHAHARILAMDCADAEHMPGVWRVLTAKDVPGENDTGPILHDEPLFPVHFVHYHGQAVAWVLADSEELAQRAAQRVRVDYEVLPACLSIQQALEQGSFHLPPSCIVRGDVQATLDGAPVQLRGEVQIGGQDHFYLETQASWVQIDSEGVVQIVASTQHPTETQIIVARVLGLAAHRVVCRSLRMGGGFGGKETQANPFAAVAAVAAWHSGRAVRIKLPRSLDMQLTGKRHPFLARYELAADPNGQLLGARVELVADGGWSCDLSPPVLSRAMVHVDNAYYFPVLEVNGRIARTHLPSNTAFRGFGGPQGIFVAEEMLSHLARHLGLPPEQVRARNFYGLDAEHASGITHYDQPVRDNDLPELWWQLLRDSDFASRREAIEAFNASSPLRKRGMAIVPVKFGISFNKTEYNQAGALVHIYADGSIQLNHGGTEMGQGLHTKMLGVAARSLGVSLSRFQIMPTSTDKVPNTSATAASTGADLNGQAIKAACETLLARLRPVAAELLNCAAEQIAFVDDHAQHREIPSLCIRFDKLAGAAYARRISLSTTGYYRTPGLHWNPASGKGHPFYYFAFGAAVAEVEVDGLTGVYTLRRIDILHDVGESLNADIDRGQIEGGFVQGMGWLTCEELRWNAQGRLMTDAPSTYKIPSLGEVPSDFRVRLFHRELPRSTEVIFGSKAVGEPPLCLGLSMREALRDAIGAFARGGTRHVPLASPATPEAVFLAIRALAE